MAEFKLNYQNKYSIDTTPDAEQPTWVELAPGITNVTPSTNDVTSDDNYYDGEGFGDTEVTGVKPSFSLSGHRKVGDPAQDYIASVMFEKGAARRTRFKWEDTNGRTMIWNSATIVNPVISGGDAQGKETFSCDINCNGAPSINAA